MCVCVCVRAVHTNTHGSGLAWQKWISLSLLPVVINYRDIVLAPGARRLLDSFWRFI